MKNGPGVGGLPEPEPGHVGFPVLLESLHVLLPEYLFQGLVASRVLFRVRQSADGTVTFNVTDGGTTDFDDTLALEAFHTDKPAHLGLGLNLASRDIARLGGQFEIQRTALGDTCATVVLPPALQPAKKEGQ